MMFLTRHRGGRGWRRRQQTGTTTNEFFHGGCPPTPNSPHIPVKRPSSDMAVLSRSSSSTSSEWRTIWSSAEEEGKGPRNVLLICVLSRTIVPSYPILSSRSFDIYLFQQCRDDDDRQGENCFHRAPRDRAMRKNSWNWCHCKVACAGQCHPRHFIGYPS